MSLSTWFRDYVFIPLGGSKNNSALRTYRNIMIVFILSGLWHGASWTFIIWGALNGFYLIIENFFKKLSGSFLSTIASVRYFVSIISMIVVFVLIDLSFVFFRSETFSKAYWIISNIFNTSNFYFDKNEIMSILTSTSGKMVFYYVVAGIIIMEAIQYFQEKNKSYIIFTDSNKTIRYAWYYFLTISIILFGNFGAQTFIYFQF